MALDVFNYQPSYSVSDDHQFRLLTAQFGDGYVQDVADGINPDLGQWSLSFNSRTKTQSDAIIAFFKAHIGVPFLWTPAGENQIQVKCRGYKRLRDDGNNYTITATFTEDVCL